MKFSWTALVFLSGAAYSTSALQYANLDVASALRNPVHPRIERSLVASNNPSQLRKRGDRLELVHNCDLDYSEGPHSEGKSSHTARIRLGSERPILLLEQVEHLMENVECSLDTISITLYQSLDVSVAREELEKLTDGFIITSHASCNIQGERVPYKIKSFSHTSPSTTVFHVEKASFESSFSQFSVSLTKPKEPHILRPHKYLRRRQDSQETSDYLTQTSTPDTTPSLASLTIAIPTATSTDSSAIFHLGDTLATALGPFTNSAGQEIPLTVGCKNCTVYGDLALDWMDFSFDCNATEMEEGIDLHDCLQGGEISIRADGLGAHIELEINVTDKAEWAWDLYEFPLLLAYQIPALGTLGLTYAPSLIGGYELNGTAAFSSGFDITIPTPSHMTIDLSDPTNSTSEGFQDTSLTPIPFSSTLALQSLTLTLALQHRIAVGIDINPPLISGDTDEVNIGAGIYLSLPQLSVKIAPVAAPVDLSCQSLSSDTSISSSDATIMAQVLNHAYALTLSVGYAFGVDAEAKMPAIPNIASKEWGHEFLNGTKELGASCVNWDEQGGGYVDAQQVFDEAKKAAEQNGGGNGDQGASGNGGDGEGAAATLRRGVFGISVWAQSLAVAVSVVCVSVIFW